VGRGPVSSRIVVPAAEPPAGHRLPRPRVGFSTAAQPRALCRVDPAGTVRGVVKEG
jgi:hypothetical protein